MRWKVLGLGIGIALLGSSQVWAQESCPVGQNQSCWEARAACEQRRAEAAASKAAGLEQQLKSTPPVLRDSVLFKTDSAKPVEETTGLSDVASVVKRTPGSHVRVEGYADSRGTQDYNHALSLRRAEAVKQQLVEQGVNKDQVDTVPLGEMSPQADNGSIEGRALNRRADIIVQTGGAGSSGEAGQSGSTITPSSQQGQQGQQGQQPIQQAPQQQPAPQAPQEQPAPQAPMPPSESPNPPPIVE